MWVFFCGTIFFADFYDFLEVFCELCDADVVLKVWCHLVHTDLENQ